MQHCLGLLKRDSDMESRIKEDIKEIFGEDKINNLSVFGKYLTAHNFIVVELGDITDRTLIDNLTKYNICIM